MEILTTRDGNTVTITLAGKLDASAAQDLEPVIMEKVHRGETIIFDMSNVEYLSSAGVRILLAVSRALGEDGSLILRHLNDSVLETLQLTGFADLLTIE